MPEPGDAAGTAPHLVAGAAAAREAAHGEAAHGEAAHGEAARDARPRVLVVDVANVVGSRPDGWWRDRVGATQRLLEQLAGAGLGPVVAVVEGRARAVVDVPGIEVVRAAGSGDDEVVAQARLPATCTVVTADRGLRARLPTTAVVVGPGHLLDRLPRSPASQPRRPLGPAAPSALPTVSGPPPSAWPAEPARPR